jgi:CelD/BcsL family acetyltransferase involved in cellulose biosynthesis
MMTSIAAHPIHMPATAAPCTLNIVSSAQEFDNLEAEWKAVFKTSPTASPPLRWEWVRQWWRIFGRDYGDHGRGLRIITIRRGTRLIGVLPLYMRRKRRSIWAARRLAFVTTGLDEFEETCAEYLDLLHSPGEEAECLEALGPALLRLPQLRCDELVLADLAESSPLLALPGYLETHSRYCQVLRPAVCHLFDMSGGFEAYLNRLSHENRRQARKMLREVEREGMQFEVAKDVEQARLFFTQMVQLHRQRWIAAGKPGSFAPRHAEFHGTLAELLLPRREAVLARLSSGGNPNAVVFGYRVKETLYCYQQGVTAGTGRVRSAGTASWLLLMRHLADEGVDLFDHQRGTSVFKERFGTGTRPLAEIHFARPGLRTIASRIAARTRRAARKALVVMGLKTPARIVIKPDGE